MAHPTTGPDIYDTALPQDWVDFVNAQHITGCDDHKPENIAAHFVWAYDHGSLYGYPSPCDSRGSQILAQVYHTGATVDWKVR